ncbi:MAG: hypothetical protein WA081_08210 [Desulfosalsimonadaceae bacterium]
MVEFGTKGNATYIYQSEQLPFDLCKSWINGGSSGLKNQQIGDRFFHRDKESTGRSWEEKFDETLCPIIGYYPKKEQVIRRKVDSTPQPGVTNKKPVAPDPRAIPPWEQEVKALSKRYGLPIKDNRHIDGAFWIMVDYTPWPQLVRLGFKFKPGKGWWKE